MSGLILLVAAGVLLAWGADLFTEHVSDLARGLRMSAVAVAVLLAGAEPEELVTSLTAVIRHHPRIAAGDAVGSNMTVLTLIAGLALVAGALPGRAAIRAGCWAALAGAAAGLLAMVDGTVTRLDGLLLCGVYAFVARATWRAEDAVAADDHPPLSVGDEGSSVLGVSIAVAALVMMTAGGRLAVEAAVKIVARFGLTDSAVGLTFVGLATSAELLALLWAAHRQEKFDLPYAAVTGSVLCNGTLTLGIPALLAPIPTGDVRPLGGAVLLLATGFPLAAGRPRLARWAGAALLAGYLAFVSTTLW